MSYRQQAKDGINIAVWILLGVIFFAVIFLGWLYLVQPRIVDQQGDIFRDSYGSEVARVDAARQGVVAFETAASEGQKIALKNQTCGLIASTQEVPSDLAAWSAKNC